VNLGEHLAILLHDKVTTHLSGPVSVKMTIQAGHPVLEIREDPKATRSFTPFRPGQRRLQLKPERVGGLGPTFPKFGMVEPLSLIMGADRVLRMTLPSKRPPLSTRGRRMNPPDKKPIKEPIKEAQAPAETAPKQELPRVGPEEKQVVMRNRDTLVSYSRSGVRVRVGRELAKFMDGSRYGVEMMEVVTDNSGDEPVKHVKFHVVRGSGYNSLGRGFGPNDEQRAISIQTIVNKKGNFPYFGPTPAAEVTVLDEGREIVIHMKPPFLPQGNRANPSSPATVTTRPKPAQAAAPTPAKVGPFTRLRAARDLVNECVAEIKASGDEVTLKIKDDGTLGFTLEG
jgi:hypothetical protein